MVSVGFKFRPTVVLTLRSTAIDTFAIFPSMLDALINDISLRFVFGELICRKLAARELAAIDTATRKQDCKFGVSSNFASADFRKIKTYNFWKSESYRFQKLRNLQISEIKSRQVVL